MISRVKFTLKIISTTTNASLFPIKNISLVTIFLMFRTVTCCRYNNQPLFINNQPQHKPSRLNIPHRKTVYMCLNNHSLISHCWSGVSVVIIHNTIDSETFASITENNGWDPRVGCLLDKSPITFPATRSTGHNVSWHLHTYISTQRYRRSYCFLNFILKIIVQLPAIICPLTHQPLTSSQ